MLEAARGFPTPPGAPIFSAMTAEGFASRLRRARIVRVLLAYLAASWLLR